MIRERTKKRKKMHTADEFHRNCIIKCDAKKLQNREENIRALRTKYKTGEIDMEEAVERYGKLKTFCGALQCIERHSISETRN